MFVSDSCTGDLGRPTGAWFVFAPSISEAQAICDVVAFGAPAILWASRIAGADPSLYYCDILT